MYYECVFGVSPEVLTVHVNQLLSQGVVAMIGGPASSWRDRDDESIPDKWLIGLINDIFAIEGVEYMEASRYSFTIYRARLLKWGKIPDKVLAAIQVNILSHFGDTEFVRNRQPTRLFYDDEGRLHEITICDPDAPIPNTKKAELQPQ
ncbi:MAG TPA: hypothetical protein VNK70_03340 [Candidatus Paceibacterota bacterium]|nr:hypothetical protein [Candidatus Paceibacterota bacterium]